MKKILFTGARSGIAKNVIEKIINSDYYIYITVHTFEEERRVKEEYKKYKNIECFKLDITLDNDRKKLNDLNIDILVLNAAVGYGGSLIEIPIQKIKDNFEVNVFSNIELTQIVLKKMIKKREGKIIFISSIASVIPIEFIGSYCSSKSSFTMIAKVLKKELDLLNTNIKIKLILPGIYKTGFNEFMLNDKDLSKSLFKNKKEDIEFKEYILFNLLSKKDLNSISKKIVSAINSDNNKFVYSAPLSQKIFSKLYQTLKN